MPPKRNAPASVARIRIAEMSGTHTEYTLARTTPLFTVLDTHLALSGHTRACTRFMHNGTRVRVGDTPNSRNMKRIEYVDSMRVGKCVHECAKV